jgi:hypothetical protein
LESNDKVVVHKQQNLRAHRKSKPLLLSLCKHGGFFSKPVFDFLQEKYFTQYFFHQVRVLLLGISSLTPKTALSKILFGNTQGFLKTNPNFLLSA